MALGGSKPSETTYSCGFHAIEVARAYGRVLTCGPVATFETVDTNRAMRRVQREGYKTRVSDGPARGKTKAGQSWGPSRPKKPPRRLAQKPLETEYVPIELPQFNVDTDTRVCGAILAGKNRGLPCQQPAGRGTRHRGWGRCNLHGGNTIAGEREAAAIEAAASAMRSAIVPDDLRKQQVVSQLYAARTEIEPEDALSQELERTQGAVEFLIKIVAQHTLAELESTAEGRVARDLLKEERDRLTRLAKSMIDIDFREKQGNLSEQLAAPIVAVIQGIVGELMLTAEQQAKVGGLVRKHLELVAGDSPEVGEVEVTPIIEDKVNAA